MTLLITISFFLALGGSFLLLELSPFDFLTGIADFIKPRNFSIKSKIEESKKEKEERGLKRFLCETKEILKLTNKENHFTALCMLSMILFVLGILIAITMENFYFVPVLAIGFSLLPFYYVKLTAGKQKRQINTELETALSMITNSYLRGKHTIIQAIEENEPYLNPPVSELFRNFLLQTKWINSNTKEALLHLKFGLDNEVFHEWVDAVIACQEDYNLKATLPAIVGKLSDMRVVSAELDLLLFEPVKEYITMIVLVISSIPIMYFLNKEWYHTLMFTEFGKMLLAICGAVIFFSMMAVSKHMKPIEYKR